MLNDEHKAVLLCLSGIDFCQNILRSKNFKQKLRHQVVEAEALRVAAIQ